MCPHTRPMPVSFVPSLSTRVSVAPWYELLESITVISYCVVLNTSGAVALRRTGAPAASITCPVDELPSGYLIAMMSPALIWLMTGITWNPSPAAIVS